MSCPIEHAHNNRCYVNHKCRCDVCKKSHANHNRAYVLRMSVEKRLQLNERRKSKRALSAKRVEVEFEPWQIAIAEKVFYGRVGSNDRASV